MRIHDISLPISDPMVVWEGQPPVAITYVRHLLDGDRATVSNLSMTVHTGTHVDAPCHHLVGGAGADELALEVLVGSAFVVTAPDAAALTPEVLESLAIPRSAERLLIHTRNSALWSRPDREFTRDYVGLTADGARWLADRGVRLVGTDYLSVAAWDHLVPAHRILLRAGVILLEGLDLGAIRPGTYELVCLPLKIAGGDGAPARAILVER
jgi:arylformamidase